MTPKQEALRLLDYVGLKHTANEIGKNLPYGAQRKLEYDFVVAPGRNPKRIALAFHNARQIKLDANGDLVLRMSDG